MKQLITLIKREWWEWKRVVLWTLGVFTFLLLLTLIPLNRMDTFVQNKIQREVEKSNDGFSETESFFREQGFSEEQIKKTMTTIKKMQDGSIGMSKEMESNVKNSIIKGAGSSPIQTIKIYSYGILAGFSTIQFFVMFIALFYFSDSLFKERSNYSTLFFRSQPVNDHLVLTSKLKTGGIGIIGVTITMLVILLLYSRVAIMTISGDLWEIISGQLNQIKVFGLLGDLVLIQIVSLLWLSPLILFMMLVSATVKNRPLIVGIGAPILLAITLQIVFGENAFVVQIGDIFGAIAEMITSQNLISEMKVVPADGVDLFGSFWGYLFSLRTLLSLLVSGLFYAATWMMYRKNISTN